MTYPPIPLLGGWTPIGYPVWWTAGPTWCFQDDPPTTACGHGDAVRVWVSRDGHGRQFTQATSGQRPILWLESGRWSVKFDGVDDILIGPNLSSVFPSAGTLGVAYLADGADNQFRAVVQTNRLNDEWDYFFGDGYPQHFRSARLEAVAAVPRGSPSRYIVRSSSSGWDRLVNGSTALSAAAAYSAGSEWAVGAGLTGRVYGLAATATAISDTERTRLDSYLAMLLP
jgi:hypothetical protein